MKHRQGVTLRASLCAWAPCLATHGFTQHILCVRSAEAPGVAASPRECGSPLRGASRTIWRCMPPGGRVCHARCGAGPRARPGSGRARRAGILHANLPVCGCASHAGALPPSPVARWPPSSPQGGPRRTGAHPRRRAASALRGRPRLGGEPRHRKGTRPGRGIVLRTGLYRSGRHWRPVAASTVRQTAVPVPISSIGTP